MELTSYYSKVVGIVMRVRNVTKNTYPVDDLRIANTFWSRLKGLLGTNSLPAGQGLLITPCDSIHMFGMRYAIDVIFLDRTYRVLKALHSLPPGTAAGCRGSAHVLEVPAGVLINTHTAVDDQLIIE